MEEKRGLRPLDREQAEVFRKLDQAWGPSLRRFGAGMFAPDEGYSPDIREIPDPKAFMALIEWIYRRGVIEVLRGIKSVEPPDTMPAEHEQWEKFFAEMKAYATGLGKALEDGTVDLRMSFITMAWLLSKGAEMKEFLWDILKVRPVIEVQEAVKNDGTPGV